MDRYVHRGKYGWIHMSVEEKRKIWMATHVRRGKEEKMDRYTCPYRGTVFKESFKGNPRQRTRSNQL